MLLSERIAAWRKAKGKTLRQVAAAIGVTHGAVSQWEQGKDPTMEHLRKLIDYFGVSTLTFYGRVPKRTKTGRGAAA